MRPNLRWWIVGGLALLAAALYLSNASWLAHPEGAAHILAHRGVHQRFSREGLTDATCTAAQSLPIRHAYLENTLPSIREAFRLGADMVEIDVHPTTDGEFAVFHDWTLDCRTNGRGVTREQPMTALRPLDLGYGYTADGGRTFPLRGRGVGMMPTLEEVLRAFPQRRFMVNIKSDDAREADLLDVYMRARGLADSHLTFAGGPRANARLKALRPNAAVIFKHQSKACMVGYLALGWSGYVPKSCDGAFVAVPLNMRHLFWGWPNRMLVRMQGAGATVYVGGDADLKRGSVDGLDASAQLVKLPKGSKGGVMTDRIELIGPALKGER
jgi:glycerophosphoryl diester phosphodiesterase